jgi:lipopolysaccharide transport system ATP-binding protein
MEDVSKEGRTVLFVSHNMNAIQYLCNKTIVMSGGKISFEGKSLDGIKYYLKNNNIRRNSDNDLSERKDRQTNGDFIFTSWKSFIDDDRFGNTTGISGQEFSIKLEYFSKKEIRNVIFSLGFFNQTGAFYTACRSDSINKRFNISEGRGEVILKFKKLPFSSGSYSFNIIAYNGQNSDVLDWVKAVGFIDVESGDYYNSGIIPASSKQGVLIDFDWIGK